MIKLSDISGKFLSKWGMSFLKIFFIEKLSHQGLSMSKKFLLTKIVLESNVHVLDCYTSGLSSALMMEKNWSLPKK